MPRFQDPGCTIFVKNIEPRVTEEHLWELFLQAGPLKNVHIPLDRETRKKRNFAFVTYRDEISVDYACKLLNQVRLFKKPIYLNPSNKDGNRSSSFNQSPSNRSSISDAPQSPNSNKSLIDGILNRSNSVSIPLTSTPFHGKRKFSEDPSRDAGRVHSTSDSRVIVIDDENDRDQMRSNNSGRNSRYNDSGRFSEHDDRHRGRPSNYGDRDRDRDRGRFDDHQPYRPNNGDGDLGYERSGSNSRDNSDSSDRRYDDRNSGQSSRFERSNSFGNMSPMHMQALNQSHNQYNRQSSSPRDNSNFGPMRQDSPRNNNRRQRNQPY